MTDRGVLRARVDPDGLLVGADPALLALNARAGGEIGAALALGAIATLARLAGRLGVLIARGVTVADDRADLDLWVRAQPDPQGVAIAIADWRDVPPWRPVPESAAMPGLPLDPDARAWEADAAMRLVAFPADGAERLGADRAAALGRPFTDVVIPAAAPDGARPVLTAFAQRHAFTDQRAQVSGSGRAVLLTGRPQHDAAGAFAGYVGTIGPDRDAESSDAAGPGFASGFGSGFGTRLEAVLRGPLGRIVATADAIHAQNDGPLRADYVDYAADIASAGRHLLALVDDLADLQAIERDDFAVAVEPLDLADVARRAGGLLGVRAADAGVAIVRPAPGSLLPATGEFHRALQVLVNLVGNAVRYSPGGATVRIDVGRDGGRAVVVVSDQGKGIAATDQTRIFDKFERIDRTEPGGSGIGLYVARRLARAMHGDLTVDSAPGEGARFAFSLPAATTGTPT